MASQLEALYQAWFRLAYSEKKGTEFESWFADLASHALGVDFEPVAAHGPDGDFKCDGRRLSTRTSCSRVPGVGAPSSAKLPLWQFSRTTSSVATSSKTPRPNRHDPADQAHGNESGIAWCGCQRLEGIVNAQDDVGSVG